MDKKEKIEAIQKIVREWGSFEIGEVEGVEPIPYLITGKDHQLMIERINLYEVDLTEYVHERVTNESSVSYDQLDEDILDEILLACESYNLDNEESWNRSQN